MKQRNSLPLKRLFRYALQGTALGVIATVGVFLFTVSPDTLAQLKNLPLRYLPLLFLLIFCAWGFTGLRVWLLARALGYSLRYRQAAVIVLCKEFGLSATPAGMGGAVIELTLLSKSGIPLATSASILAADLGVDAAFFTIFVSVGLFFILKEPVWGNLLKNMGNVSLVALLGVLTMTVIMLAGIFSGKWLEGVRESIENSTLGDRYRLPARFRYVRWKISANVRRSWEVIRFLYRYRRFTLLANLLLGTCQWLCRYGVLPLILIAFSSDRNPVPLIFIQNFLFAIGLILFLPGGGGGIEVITPFILQHYVPVSFVGIVLVLWRFFTYHLYLLVGGVTFFWTCTRLELIFNEFNGLPNVDSLPTHPIR
jgi:uncharacterized protein (TIRG00374 family)